MNSTGQAGDGAMGNYEAMDQRLALQWQLWLQIHSLKQALQLHSECRRYLQNLNPDSYKDVQNTHISLDKDVQLKANGAGSPAFVFPVVLEHPYHDVLVGVRFLSPHFRCGTILRLAKMLSGLTTSWIPREDLILKFQASL